jgi:hypothetical protein
MIAAVILCLFRVCHGALCARLLSVNGITGGFGLLLNALGLSEIKHFVVSRFPIITEDPRIIAYNALGGLSDLVA